jgi:hypothetical protein
MHISGKIAAWFAAVGIVVAAYMSIKALQVRDAWMLAAQTNEAAIVKNDDEIAKKTKIFEEKRADLARTMLGWDRTWFDVQAAVNQQGILNLGIGSARGVQQDQVLYVFAPSQDGAASIYVGDFKVSRVVDNQAEAKPNSRRRPEDLKPAQFAAARVRTLIPPQFQSRLETLNQQLLAAELSIATNKDELAAQGRLFDQTEKLIAARMAEINGDAALAGKPLPPVHVKGLLTAIVDEEEARNAALIEADELMRDLKQVRDKFADIRKANEQRVRSLPQPAPSEPSVGATGR